MNATKYRYATEAELPLLARLNSELMADEQDKLVLSTEELEERMKGWLQQGHRAVLFETDGEVLGYALYCVAKRTKGEALIFLRHFLVRSIHRRKGAGREVFHHLVHELWPHNVPICLDVKCKNMSARAFWNALGFHETSITLEREAKPTE